MTSHHKKTDENVLNMMMDKHGQSVCPISNWENEGGYFEAGALQTTDW